MIKAEITVSDDKSISISGFPNDEIISLGLVEKVKDMLLDHFKDRQSMIVKPGAGDPVPSGARLRSIPGNGGQP